MNGSTCVQPPTASNRSAALPSSSTGIICGAARRRSAGARRTRLTLVNLWLRRHWPPDAMPSSAMNLWTVGCADPHLTAQARSPMGKPGKTPYVEEAFVKGSFRWICGRHRYTVGGSALAEIALTGLAAGRRADQGLLRPLTYLIIDIIGYIVAQIIPTCRARNERQAAIR